MDFNEKLQKLRKSRNLTQEELAQLLFVSRTAISKWESGRGVPSLESLKAIGKLFSVTLDELLSGEEIVDIAKSEQIAREDNYRDLIYGLLDSFTALLLFLPFLGQETSSGFRAVSLIAASSIQPYLKISYFIFVGITVLLGIITLALQNSKNILWYRSKNYLSLIISTAGVFLFIISRQPYAAVLIFAFLFIKALLLIKRG